MLVTNLKVAADIIFLERVKTPFFEEKNTLITCVFSPRNVNKKGELYASLQGSGLVSKLTAFALEGLQ